MVEVRWERYPKVATFGPSRTWLQIQANLGLARNTIEAYGRALEIIWRSLRCPVLTSSQVGENTFRHTSVI
jgi:hypothetical protein